MNARDLVYLYELNRVVFRENAAGLTHDESLRAPAGGGNCLNWVLGHVLATRHAILKTLKSSGWWPAETVDLYKRGSATLAGDEPGIVRWETLVAEFETSHAAIVAALQALSEAELAEPAGRGPGGIEMDVAHRAAFLQFHEAYHLGQIGLLRRMAGHERAIG